MINDDMITNFKFLGKICVLDTDKIIVSNNFFLAVEEELLACFDLDARFSIFNVTKTDSGSLQVNIDATLLSRHFCSFSYHLNQYLVLFVLDLCCIDPANVHTFLQKFNNRGLDKKIDIRL